MNPVAAILGIVGGIAAIAAVASASKPKKRKKDSPDVRDYVDPNAGGIQDSGLFDDVKSSKKSTKKTGKTGSKTGKREALARAKVAYTAKSAPLSAAEALRLAPLVIANVSRYLALYSRELMSAFQLQAGLISKATGKPTGRYDGPTRGALIHYAMLANPAMDRTDVEKLVASLPPAIHDPRETRVYEVAA